MDGYRVIEGSGRAIRVSLSALAVGFTACIAQGESQGTGEIQQLAEVLVPRVERAVGLSFKSPPQVAVRSPEALRAYLTNKLDDELPPEEMERLIVAYQLFGLIPDTIDMRELLLALYLEQVVGYYDPDSAMLYMVETADPSIVQFTLAHELVHALQGQYVPLDSLVSLRRQNDRKMAAQAVFEGQATLASFQIVFPGIDLERLGESWRDYSQAVRQQQERMPVFASAPLVIRETLVFPYLAGADFVWWFVRTFTDAMPYGSRLPRSTEQILHPERYRRGDEPVALAFPDAGDVFYEDGLGEFETRILLTVLSGSAQAAASTAEGWGGDRYAVFRDADGEHSLVWVSVWDDDGLAERFTAALRPHWHAVELAGRRITVDRMRVDNHAAVRVVNAPIGWRRWEDLPEARVVR